MFEINELLMYLYERKKVLNYYIEGLNKLGYTKKEIQCLYSQIEIINSILDNITFKSIYDLISNSSNRRLDRIISGDELIPNILLCPEDYNLVIDLDELSKSDDTKNALVFRDIRDKYCYLKHKDLCTKGLKYVNGKWQKLK